MVHKVFEEFYFATEEQIKDIKELNDFYDERKEYSHFDGKIFCPECKKARLKYVPKSHHKRSYLASIDLHEHMDDCSYKYEQASQKQISLYLNKINNFEIKNKLESMLNKLNKESSRTTLKAGVLSNNNEDNPFLIPEHSSNGQVKIKKSIPQCNLKFELKEEDVDCIFLFYGDVYLSVEKEEKERDGEKYWIYYLMMTTKEKRQKYKIYRGSKKDNVIENQLYQIVLFGFFEKRVLQYQLKKIELIKKENSPHPNQSALIFREKILV